MLIKQVPAKPAAYSEARQARKQRALKKIGSVLAAPLLLSIGLFCGMVVLKPVDPNDMATHWRQFVDEPTWFNYQVVSHDVKGCARTDCVRWSSLREQDVARLVTLAQTNNLYAEQIALLINRDQDDDDIGAEDIVLCCGALIKSDPQGFVRFAVKSGLSQTTAVTSTQSELDEDYTATDRELKARRAALMHVTQKSLAPARDAFVQALDKAILINSIRVGTAEDEGAKS